MSFPKYEAYKDSGLQRVGAVPSHWQVCDLKRMCETITDGAHISPETENGVFPFVSTQDLDGSDIDFEGCLRTSEASYEYMVRTGCKPRIGDVLFSKDGTIGRTVVVRATRDFVVASSLIIIRPDNSLLYPNYLHHLCQSAYISAQINSLVKGAGLPRLSIKSLLRVVGVFAPLAEQLSIATFLDRETAKIDALVQEQQRLIKLLKEKRQAVISNAVTKGLNPDAPMKDSGVEWLGAVPEHWDMKAVWMMFTLGRGRVISHQDIANLPGPYPVYSSQTENEGEMGSIGTYDFEGDYLTWTTDGANAGTVFRRSGRFNCTNVCGTLKPKAPVNLDFLQALLSLATAYFVRHDINPKLMNNVMGKIKLPVPPLDEQTLIMENVDQVTNGFFEVMQEAEATISLLQERRSALISAAVTGKIDVRGLVSVEAEAA